MGYVWGNLMVNVQPKNSKLRDRSKRIIAEATGVSYEEAGRMLTAAGDNVRDAIAAWEKPTAQRQPMDKFVIEGGAALNGTIATNGSKNSALPALAAALLTAEPVVLERIPRVRDIRTMERLLVDIGSEIEVDGERVTLNTKKIVSPEAPYELVKTMRASSLVLGPLVARAGRARVSMPGGCAIGARPINFHLAGLEHLGAQISQEHGYIEAVAPNGLKGAQVVFDRITVTGTEDILMAAVLARWRNRDRERRARAGGGGSGASAAKDGRADRRRGDERDPGAGRFVAAWSDA